MAARPAGPRARSAPVEPSQLRVESILFREARRAYGYVPAHERPERIAEELADEE